MVKRGVYLYLDDGVIEILKRRGINISAEVNRLLSTLAKADSADDIRIEAERIIESGKQMLEMAEKRKKDEEADYNKGWVKV